MSKYDIKEINSVCRTGYPFLGYELDNRLPKLNLGCYYSHLDGFINVDLNPDVNPDVICDIRDLKSKFKDNSISLILLSQTLEHVIFAGFTHTPAINLAKRLIEKAPKGLQKVFFADNGSSAVEIALKMAFHFFHNNKEDRPLFVSLENSYHGETLGALSVGDVDLYKKTYNPLLIRSLQTAVPASQSYDDALIAAQAFELLCEQNRGKISALIVEPLVQCAGGMKMYHPVYLTKVKKICTAHNIFLIADEIAVGFGRTGTFFAVEQANITPDFICLSKGITGGFLPLSTVLTTQKIYDAFYAPYGEMKAFLHSHSYTGNPIACAAANSVLDIFDDHNILALIEEKSQWFEPLLTPFYTLDCVKEVRQKGMIVAIELQGFSPEERVGLKISSHALSLGVLIRPLGNVVYMMPPYVISQEEMKQMVDGVYQSIKKVSQ
jgi:adenosylmethionine-8-amino-7-oxononanoate aminotransferase